MEEIEGSLIGWVERVKVIFVEFGRFKLKVKFHILV
jgi:hypothetical protein